jgi:SAM-dependent methyltransferase
LADVGCGRGAYADDSCKIRKDLRILKGKCRRVIGIDVDSNAQENPHIDEFRLIKDSRFPINDCTINVLVADHVLEHLQDPITFFRECNRVLRPGGYFCARTPNAWGYVAVISRLLPNRYHAKIASNVQSGRQAKDIFPTYYRCNTRRTISRLYREHNMDGCVIGYEAEPTYFEFSRFFYWLGMLHQMLAPEMFRLSLFCFARKANSPIEPSA